MTTAKLVVTPCQNITINEGFGLCCDTRELLMWRPDKYKMENIQHAVGLLAAMQVFGFCAQHHMIVRI